MTQGNDNVVHVRRGFTAHPPEATEGPLRAVHLNDKTEPCQFRSDKSYTCKTTGKVSIGFDSGRLNNDSAAVQHDDSSIPDSNHKFRDQHQETDLDRHPHVVFRPGLQFLCFWAVDVSLGHFWS